MLWPMSLSRLSFCGAPAGMSMRWPNGSSTSGRIACLWSAVLRRRSSHGSPTPHGIILLRLAATRSPALCNWPQCGRILGSRPHCPGAIPVSDNRVNMEADWQKSPDAVRRQPKALAAPLAEFLRWLKREPPSFVFTSARGSSAHAATFGKHLIERHLGLPVGAFAPNVATIYKQRLKLNGQLFLTVSQSGRSDDLIESAA